MNKILNALQSLTFNYNLLFTLYTIQMLINHQKASQVSDKPTQEEDHKDAYTGDKFLNITKRLLLDLAPKRKSLKNDMTQRASWHKRLQEKENGFPKYNLDGLYSHQIQASQIQARASQSSIKNVNSEQNIIVLDSDEQVKPKNSGKQQICPQQNQQKQEQQIQAIFQKIEKKETKLPIEKMRLFPLSLRNLTSLFLSQVYENHQNNAVSRAINSDIQIKNQIDKLSQIFKGPECWHHFNQDRMAILHEKRRGDSQPDIFDSQFVTIYEHRALAMLIKRTNSKKYSLTLPQKNQNQGIKQCRNDLTNKFYVELYQEPLQQYYKKLLQNQLKYKRYTDPKTKKKKPIIGLKPNTLGATNFVRKLLLAVFEDKVRGEGSIKEDIMKLQTSILTGIVADDLLMQMRMKIQGEPRKIQKKQIQQNIYEMEDQGQQCQGLIKGRKISKKQRLAIQRALEGFKKNRKQVPFPYCMFLQYRLRAQRQPHYQNPQNPSSDEDEEAGQVNKRRQQYKKYRQSNVYRGYRGYKTNNKIAEIRKMNKGIAKNAKQFAREEEFYLKPFPMKNQASEMQPETSTDVKHEQQKQSQVEHIPFPYYLSIFSQNHCQKKNSLKTQEEIQDQIIKNLELLHRQHSHTTKQQNLKGQ